MDDNYAKYVEGIESQFKGYAKRSFEPDSQVFVNGISIQKHYQDLWSGPDRARLLNRTPLQRERDRILYSDAMRRLTEKYHVLYSGQERIVRNYTTHTLRMAQVTRSVSRALGLNIDFAEAIALGVKLGAAPFVHASKDVLASFIKTTVSDLDRHSGEGEKGGKKTQLEFPFDAECKGLEQPQWLAAIKDDSTRREVVSYVPWSLGAESDPAYSSGREAYWLLLTNPFTRESRSATYLPETMYGIWRHSLDKKNIGGKFLHKIHLGEVCHRISSEHITYEAVVAQYADDITWVIENLNDANRAGLLSGRSSKYSLFDELERHLRDVVPKGDIQYVTNALRDHDTGSLYTYFIVDFVTSSERVLSAIEAAGAQRGPLVAGESGAQIGLSAVGWEVLSAMKAFLDESVFKEPRVANRKKLLNTLTAACVDLLYKGDRDFLERRIQQKGELERWSKKRIDDAMDLLRSDVHKMQLSIDVFSEMSDQDIFDFVGIQSI